MKKNFFVILLLALIIFNVSCSGDPSGNFFWIIYGFPFLGASYVVGVIIMNLFSSDKKENENNVFISIVIGVIVISIIYSIFKYLMK